MTLQTVDGGSQVRVEIVDGYHLDRRPGHAFEEIAEDADGDVYTAAVGGTFTETITAAKRINHQGRPALYLAAVIRPDGASIHCTTRSYALVVLAEPWNADTRNAFFVQGTHCEGDTTHEEGLTRALDSFRQTGHG